MPRALWLQGCFPSETRKSITYKSCPSTGVCWSMKICFSHLPDFQLLPYGMCEEKRWHENLFNNPRLKSGLLQLPFSFTVMPPLNFFVVTGKAESSQTLVQCHSTWKLIKCTHKNGHLVLHFQQVSSCNVLLNVFIKTWRHSLTKIITEYDPFTSINKKKLITVVFQHEF